VRTAISLAALALAILLAGGCGNRLLIKGLKLPEGSQEVTFVKDAKANLPPQTKQFGGEVEQAVKVSFNHSGGWDAVTGSIDMQMTAAGYPEQLQAMAAEFGGGMLAKVAGATVGAKVRLYGKPRGKYAAVLLNNKAEVPLLDKLSPGTAPAAGDGDFTLFVARFRTENQQ
jgi:hypothetical protein